MNLLSIGASYRTADVAVLERLAIGEPSVPGLLQRLVAQPYVGEAVVVSTCNRVEVYAAVSGFHGGLGDICNVLSEHSGIPASELAGHLYVHYGEAAVRHSFRVSAGLDSMVVGEAQILGQLRDAYHAATEVDSAGRLLHELMQQTLRVGKRAHAETGIDRAGQSVVTAALDLAAEHLGADLAGRSALVIGAGAMGALSVATLTRAGVGPLRITNRSHERADRLAEAYGAIAVRFDELDAVLKEVDLVVCATASTVPVLTRQRLERVGRELVVLDLAVPRDVAPDAAGLPGVHIIDIDSLATSRRAHPVAAETAAVEQIVATEVENFLGWLRGAEIAPTVAALRTRAEEVVSAEMRKLIARRPEFTEEQRGDVSRTLHRVVQQLLHSPTVRVRQLAAEPGGDQYAALLRELFDLDVPLATQANAVPEIGGKP
ncbi:glutamyl-tRNA reductase [Actinoplanes hulinensis]|uniref:Glutamyl-tRNA reductase n=2 Tax=Actinoplanes TaxID=1865 RepID=A0A7W5AIY1_9ACTN|nr:MULTISPECIES: glutamyl-tRNA reductase [Actinoplanes]MBB3097108.1 glutamyl-tRNA reductase [Actinoplanes campanulatus]MBW6433018.1 glutamyl-tRNA reductase [Actinoplanes hulinensis]GGN15757.1 glutamyl-tRNA reductase [Actinoplanes campanulatus]GID37711.1 glutamyl-tRNA reductase [Actinoplanes campanulatus]